jgi:phosphatidate cytidylyltransferase
MKETLTRAVSGALYIVILIGCILHSQQAYQILLGCFLTLSVFELCKIFGLNYFIPVVVAAFLYIYLTDLAFRPLTDGILNATAVLTLLGLVVYLFQSGQKEIPLYFKYFILLGYLIIPFIILNKIPIGVKGYNPKIIISIFVIIWTNDTFAYLVGKNFGKRKLFEQISPKKTIEGFVGGLIFGLLAGYLLSKYYIQASLMFWLIISAIVVVFGTLGDLIESKFKRVAQVKDSGKIMPGHGGILDRLDSIIFAAPFVFLFYQIMYYVS